MRTTSVRSIVRALVVFSLTVAASSAALGAQGDCGQPSSNGAAPTASDCLFILRTATGAATCEPECICDTNGAGGTTATDALTCLKVAVGQPDVTLACPCGGDTTTTVAAPTTTIGGGSVLLGALTRTNGRFNYDLTIGIPGSDSACAGNFAGTHTCTFAELLEAEAASELVGLQDTDGFEVRSFWAIDATHDNDTQCGAVVPWDYATAHTGQFAEFAELDNDTGDLGEVESGLCTTQRWVGCCQ